MVGSWKTFEGRDGNSLDGLERAVYGSEAIKTQPMSAQVRGRAGTPTYVTADSVGGNVSGEGSEGSEGLVPGSGGEAASRSGRKQATLSAGAVDTGLAERMSEHGGGRVT